MLQVRAAFQQLKEPSWLVVDASQPVEQIHEQVH
jgi:thymidylate kinase